MTLKVACRLFGVPGRTAAQRGWARLQSARCWGVRLEEHPERSRYGFCRSDSKVEDANAETRIATVSRIQIVHTPPIFLCASFGSGPGPMITVSLGDEISCHDPLACLVASLIHTTRWTHSALSLRPTIQWLRRRLQLPIHRDGSTPTACRRWSIPIASWVSSYRAHRIESRPHIGRKMSGEMFS
jgi:hypothetical protein